MSLLSDLIAGIHARDRMTGWRRVAAHPETWTEAGIARRRDVVVGSQAITDGANRIRYVRAELFEAQGGVTDGELARLYLRRCRRQEIVRLGCTGPGDMARHRIPWSADQLPALEAARAPLYFDGTSREGEWAYVDLTAAFARLYLPLGLAPRYYRAGDLAADPILVRSAMAFERPEEWLRLKGPRNTLVGIAGSRGMITTWRKGQEVPVRRINDCFSPSIPAWCMDACSALAEDLIVRFGMATWTTDGGIVARDRAEEVCAYVRGAWGLDMTVRAEGPGRIWHATCWEIGEESTAQALRLDGGPVSAVGNWPTDWYRQRAVRGAQQLAGTLPRD